MSYASIIVAVDPGELAPARVTLAAHLAGPLPPVPMLALSVAVGGSVYAATLWLFARAAVHDAWAMLRRS